MATAQPIAFHAADPQDYPMGSGSYTTQNAPVNASYTRHFLGSPLSFRSGSFGSRFYPGMSPGQLLGPLDPNEFKLGKMSSSIESDRGSIVNALTMLERQDELCRDYTCCGLNLNDLHALVDHFEECHVVVVDPCAPQQHRPQAAPLPTSAAPQNVPLYHHDGTPGAHTTSTHLPVQPRPQHHISYQGFDPDDMELDVDQNTSGPSSGAPSPPDTPISTPGYSSPRMYSALSSPHASQPVSPISAFDTTTVLPSRGHHPSTLGGFRSSVAAGPSGSARTEDAFNTYAGYSDYSSLLPGAAPLGSGPNAMFMQTMNMNATANGQAACDPAALTLAGSNPSTPDTSPAASRVASPIPGPSGSNSSAMETSSSSRGVVSSPRASTTLSRPASSLLLSKPFKCPKPNCNKSYKQANGLKYHMTHGSCNFAPPKDLEHLQELLSSKRREKAQAAGENGTLESEVTLSESEMRDIEKEAERRLRPYACSVGDCQRRYKNMNGLRYHYQHSGDHGAIGLALLASGQHECLQHNKPQRHATPSNYGSGPSSPTSSTPRSPRSPISPISSFDHTAVQPFPPLPTYETALANSTAQQQYAQPPSYQTAVTNTPSYAYQPNQFAQQYVSSQQQQAYARGVQQHQ